MRPRPELVSVVIPAFNAAATIEQQLGALATQRYDGRWEVIVADNGSRDSTASTARRWSDRLPGLQVVDASGRRGSAFARNAGVAAAKGDFLAFCEADDVVAPGWLTAIVDAALTTDMVGGLMELESLNDPVTRVWTDWRLPGDRLTPPERFLPSVFGANCGIWRSVLDDVGGWNVGYRVLTDRELSWRVQLASYRLSFVPTAVVHYRVPSSLRGLWKKNYREAKVSVQFLHDFGGIGAESGDNAIRIWGWLVTRVPNLARDRKRRGRYVRILANRTGRLVGSVRYRRLSL